MGTAVLHTVTEGFHLCNSAMVQCLKGRRCITVERKFDVMWEAGITVKGQAAEGKCTVWEQVENRSVSVIFVL